MEKPEEVSAQAKTQEEPVEHPELPFIQKRFLRKAKALQAVPLDPLNVQTGVACQIIEIIIEEKQEAELEKTRSALGVIFSIFRSLGFLRGFCFFLVFMSFFFQIPAWCYELGTNITKNCSIDQDRVEYYTTKLLTFEMWPAYIISWSCQAFLIANQIFAIIFATQKVYIFRVLAMLICLILDIVTGILYLKGTLKMGINPYFKIGFIIMYSQTLRDGSLKLLKSIKESFPAILIYSLNILVFSGIAFILFYGKQPDLMFRHSKFLRQSTLLLVQLQYFQKKLVEYVHSPDLCQPSKCMAQHLSSKQARVNVLRCLQFLDCLCRRQYCGFNRVHHLQEALCRHHRSSSKQGRLLSNTGSLLRREESSRRS